jgi:hypothetical protein
MLRQEVDGDTSYIVWKAETADDRFSFCGQLTTEDPS